MKRYKLTVEGVYFHDPDGQLIGFFTTFNVDSASAIGAARMAATLLLERLASSHLTSSNLGPFRSFAYVNDIWQMEDSKSLEQVGGFSIYSIGFISKCMLLSKKLYIEHFKKNRVLRLA